jgi:hypothetical protein
MRPDAVQTIIQTANVHEAASNSKTATTNACQQSTPFSGNYFDSQGIADMRRVCR